MKLTIDIPEEFVSEYKDDKFSDSLQRLKNDVHLCTGNYEKEVVDMLIKAFRNAKEEDTPKLPTPPHPRWEPKEGESFFAIGTHGSIREYTNGKNSDSFNCCYNVANVYASADDTLFAIERRIVIAKMQEWAGKWNDDYTLVYAGDSDIVTFSRMFKCSDTFGEMRFATEKDAENCIKTVGAGRIKKYYFMIP